MAKHKIKEVSSGNEYESWITPVCSCGWRGKAVSCYHNFQLHEVAKATREHLNNVEEAKK